MWKIWLWIKEAMEGIFRNLTINTFAAALSLLSFFVLSFWIVIAINIQVQSDVIEQGQQISVNLKEEQDDYQKIHDEIMELDGVKEVSFFSKEEAYEIMLKELGDNEDMLTGLGFNPLPATFDVKVDNPQDIKLIAKQIESLGVAKSIKYGENYIEKLFETTEGIQRGIYLVLIVMIVSTGAMIFMSIRLNILNRNKELEIKDLIGAGKINIRVPFIIEGIMLTVSTAILMLFLIYFFYDDGVAFVTKTYPGTVFANKSDIMSSLIPVLMIIAVSIGVISSFLSTQRYLKRH